MSLLSDNTAAGFFGDEWVPLIVRQAYSRIQQATPYFCEIALTQLEGLLGQGDLDLLKLKASVSDRTKHDSDLGHNSPASIFQQCPKKS